MIFFYQICVNLVTTYLYIFMVIPGDFEEEKIVFDENSLLIFTLSLYSKV